jgi:hypothetical protein
MSGPSDKKKGIHGFRSLATPAESPESIFERLAGQVRDHNSRLHQDKLGQHVTKLGHFEEDGEVWDAKVGESKAASVARLERERKNKLARIAPVDGKRSSLQSPLMASATPSMPTGGFSLSGGAIVTKRPDAEEMKRIRLASLANLEKLARKKVMSEYEISVPVSLLVGSSKVKVVDKEPKIEIPVSAVKKEEEDLYS